MDTAPWVISTTVNGVLALPCRGRSTILAPYRVFLGVRKIYTGIKIHTCQNQSGQIKLLMGKEKKTFFRCVIHVVQKVTFNFSQSTFHHILFHLSSIKPKYTFINKLPG